MARYPFDCTSAFGIVILHKVFVVYVKYKQGATGFEYDIRFIEQT